MIIDRDTMGDDGVIGPALHGHLMVNILGNAHRYARGPSKPYPQRPRTHLNQGIVPFLADPRDKPEAAGNVVQQGTLAPYLNGNHVLMADVVCVSRLQPRKALIDDRIHAPPGDV
jgi:hypothetical protein